MAWNGGRAGRSRETKVAGYSGKVRDKVKSKRQDSHAQFQRVGSLTPGGMGIPERNRLGLLTGLGAGWTRRLGPWAVKSWLA